MFLMGEISCVKAVHRLDHCKSVESRMCERTSVCYGIIGLGSFLKMHVYIFLKN